MRDKVAVTSVLAHTPPVEVLGAHAPARECQLREPSVCSLCWPPRLPSGQAKPMPQAWIQARIELPLRDIDAVEDLLSGLLPDLGALGIEYTDQPRAMIATFRGVDAEQVANEVRGLLKQTGVRADVEACILHQDEWAPYWDEAFEPLRFGPLAVVPSWAERPTDAEQVLVLDPSQAFGTGLHPTTALCLQRIVQLGPVTHLLDVGCGSGILSLGALLLGVQYATGVDIDQIAVEAALKAAQMNGLSARFEASTGSLTELKPHFPLIVANVRPGPLLALAADIYDRLDDGGRLILSGMKTEEVQPVLMHYEGLGLQSTERWSLDNWVALEFGSNQLRA